MNNESTREILDEINQAGSWVWAKKNRPIWAKRLESASTIETLEGVEQVECGTYVCRGEYGELWPQSAKRLKAKYMAVGDRDSEGWQKCVPNPDAGGVLAAQVEHPFVLQSTWGELAGKAGDFIVKNAEDRDTAYPEDVWIVDQTLFHSTYEELIPPRQWSETMNRPIPVEFAPDVESALSRILRDTLRAEISDVFHKVSPSQFPPEKIRVSRCFSGYSLDSSDKIVLGIEVRYATRYATHVVKIGSKEKVGVDHDGWQACTHDRQVSSRIFAPITFVANVAGNDQRVAVLYRDAYHLFGPSPADSQPKMLEEIFEMAVMGSSPDPLSVERVIAQVYTDLGLWFFPGAEENSKKALEFYREQLCWDREDEPPVLDRWREEPDRQQLRRDAVWVICGRDKPDADLFTIPFQYLDPVDFVSWMLAADDGSRLPKTLVGRAHGDLHGRNILLGIRRNEAEYPAVVDYGEMGVSNVLAWDFAKLEMELKVRTLPSLLREAVVREKLWEEVGFDCPKELPQIASHDSLAVERAARLKALLAFERLLDALTCRILSRDDAEPIHPLRCELQTGADKLDRLSCMLMRIRKEAAFWLGFKHHQRQKAWRDEYYLALAIYGLLNIRWDYESPQVECALVTAGAAAAFAPSTPNLLRDAIEMGSTPNHEYPSYRVPLAIAHSYWESRAFQIGCDFVEEVVLDVTAPNEFKVRSGMGHAVPLIAEAALLEMEKGHFAAAEILLGPFRALARQFGDYETLGRIGRLFKDSGDLRWSESNAPFSELKDSAACKMYHESLTAYEDAFMATDDYYTGINSATLALLANEPQKSKEYAERVKEICRHQELTSRTDRYWVFASAGEASLLTHNWKEAVDLYGDALKELSPGQFSMADSAYKQVRRIRKAMKDHETEIQSVLSLFEKSPFSEQLSVDLLP